MCHDLIIVGAGIAGLTVGLETLKKHPGLDVIILEQYDYVGGRVLTHHQGKLSWEAGAGRIGDAHHQTHALLKRYGLSTYPIGSSDGSTYVRDGIAIPNPFTDLLPSSVLPLDSLSPSVLATHTLAELLVQVYGTAKAFSLWNMFPYWAEIHTLRADLAIHSFESEFGRSAQYSVVAGGYSQVTDGLMADFKRLGGKVQFKTTVKTVNEDSKGWCLETDGKDVIGRTCVLAIPSVAIQKLNKEVTRRIPALPHLAMKPLVRMYAVFKDKEWLQDLHKIVCDSKVRYVIPISAEKGVIMISYTDGDDASYWIRFQKKNGDKAVQNAIMKEIRKLLPDKDIGDPVEFVIHPWSNGCTYWLPGTYNPKQMLKESMNPAPGLFVCGESFSMRQAWVEGALESAEDCISLMK